MVEILQNFVAFSEYMNFTVTYIDLQVPVLMILLIRYLMNQIMNTFSHLLKNTVFKQKMISQTNFLFNILLQKEYTNFRTLGVGNLFFLTLHALGVKLQFDSQILIGKFCPEGRNFDYNQLLLEEKMIMEMKKQARVIFSFFTPPQLLYFSAIGNFGVHIYNTYGI